MNVYGPGAWSSSVTIKASGAPDRMSAITVIKDPSNDSKALIEWVLPFNNFETITSLEI